MSTNKNEKQEGQKEDQQLNAEWQGVDKAPGEEEGIAEKVTKNDIKGKKVDADPAKESDKPLQQ